MTGRGKPDPDRVAEVLDAVQSLAPGDRAAAAAAACEGDDALLDEVRSLLAADRSLIGFLRDPAAGGGPAVGRPSPGGQIGPYRLLEKIGEGGFGVVYRARQTAPVRREVALKIIRPGMETDRVIARFEAERQALAMMDHPGIARVFDAGATADGRPYFVMELVEGEPVTAYCDRARLGVRDRLGLFVEVCRAVQHAHQKGVIHRDIKPTNVLVSSVDGAPLPKVIDFGIAKAIDAELTTRTVLTEQRQLVGTPAYMSPEQAAMSGLDVDTRSDIYSLGVLLYELLTGSAPFDDGALLEGGLVEMLRAIREEEPQRPSARLATRGRMGAAPAETRWAEARRSCHALRGDLDWIVMRCLEKERSRRYQSAGDLAADVVRHLGDQPVVAGPPSVSYRLRKFARRHRGPVAAGAVIALVAAAGVVGMGVALAKLEERAGQLERVADFQAEQLGAIHPEVMGEGLRRAVIGAAPEDAREGLAAALAGVNFTTIALGTLEEHLFEQTQRAISERFADQPMVRAQLLETQAKTLAALGLPAEAATAQEDVVRLRRAELGERDPRTIRAVASLGALHCDRGHVEEGEPLLRGALALSRRVLGDDARATIETLNSLGGVLVERGELAEAEALISEALERSRRALPADDSETLRSLNNLTMLLQKQGRFEEAIPPQRQVVAGAERTLGPDDWATMVARNNLATLLFRLGRLDEAEPQFRGVLRTRRRMLGDGHPDTLLSINNLGVVVERLGGLEEARALHLEAYEGRRDRLGADHAFTLSSLNNLGSVYKELGMLGEAEACYRGALEGLRGALGGEHPYTLMASGNLAGVMMMRGDNAGAIELLEPAVGLARRVWTGDNTRIYATMLSDLGAARGGVGAFAAGEEALLDAYALLGEGLGPDHESTRSCAGKLAALYRAWHAADPAAGHDAAVAVWLARAE